VSLSVLQLELMAMTSGNPHPDESTYAIQGLWQPISLETLVACPACLIV
jgi:hypothetical protein